MDVNSRCPKVYFNYHEDKAALEIIYDKEKRRVTIRSGRHGYALFASLFSNWALSESAAWDDHHWETFRPEEFNLKIIFDADFTDDERG